MQSVRSSKDVPREVQALQDRVKADHKQQNGGISKQRKFWHSETYHAAPLGYVFMPLGTPVLADLCKDLSRKEGYPIHVVNAKPSGKSVLDPTKVAHHVQRIGYHFKDSVVEDACSQLHYMIADGKFVSESDMKQNSFVAKVMARHGLSADKLTKREPTEKLKAAIREVFPAIPNDDLDQVVKHAWDEGTGRVGTMEDMDLSRRIQLAVLARIRHTYTDYDTLLRVFDWTECRKIVEPSCLKKLLEWRGELGSGTDNGLEDIVAETMLLDEQSGTPDNRRPRQHRSRLSGIESGDASDTSIEFTHRIAAADDLRAESPAERSHRYFQVHMPPSLEERHGIARAKIQAARDQMQHPTPQHSSTYNQYDRDEHVERIHVPTDRNGQAPSQIVVNGMVLQRATAEDLIQSSHPYQPQTSASYQPVHGTPAPVQQAMPPRALPRYQYQPQPLEQTQYDRQPNPAPYPPMPPIPLQQVQQYAQPSAQYAPHNSQPLWSSHPSVPQRSTGTYPPATQLAQHGQVYPQFQQYPANLHGYRSEK